MSRIRSSDREAGNGFINPYRVSQEHAVDPL